MDSQEVTAERQHPPGNGTSSTLAGGAGRWRETASSRLRRLTAGRGQTTAVPAVVSLIVIAVFFQSQSGYFLSARNLTNLAVQITIIASIALGEIAVLLLGEIDLSLGSVSGASAAVLGVLLTSSHARWWVAIIAMFACGAAMGLFQGFWIAWVRVPSFVVTLAGLLGYLGLQLLILGPHGTISVFDPHIIALTSTALPPAAGWIVCAVLAVLAAGAALMRLRPGRQPATAGSSETGRTLIRLLAPVACAVVVVAVLNQAGGVPTAFIVLIGFIAVGWVITRYTRPGRHLFAVGGSDEAARRAGIRVRGIRFAAFGLAGIMAGLGGLLSVAYNGSSGTLTGGGELLLDAIGAAVIGGTSLFGGEGTVWAALFGALVMGGVANGLDLTNHAAPVKYIIQGLIVLLAVALDTVLRRRRKSGAAARV